MLSKHIYTIQPIDVKLNNLSVCRYDRVYISSGNVAIDPDIDVSGIIISVRCIFYDSAAENVPLFDIKKVGGFVISVDVPGVYVSWDDLVKSVFNSQQFKDIGCHV